MTLHSTTRTGHAGRAMDDALDARRPGMNAPAAQQPDWPDEAALDRALKQIASYPAPRLRRRGPQPHRRRSARWPPARRSCSRRATAPRVVRDVLGRQHPGEAARHPADGRGAHLLPRRPRGEGRAHRRPVRQAPLVAHRARSATSSCPSFRGHIVNDIAPTAAARIPDPERLVQAYHQSASTLNLLRAFTKGGFADLVGSTRGRRSSWPPATRAGATSASPARSSGPCGSCRPAASTSTARRSCTRSTSTRATRRSSSATRRRSPGRTRSRATGTTARPTCCGSASAPAQLDGAHVEFLRGVGNPLGCKVGPTATPTRCSSCATRSTRTACPGRLTLITRMGADRVEERLRPLLRAVTRRRAPRGVGLRPDARQHLHRRPAAARPATSTTCCAEIAGFVARPPRRGHLARRRPRRAHRRRRHRVPRRRRGDARPQLDDRYETDVRPPAQRPPVARPRLPGGRARAGSVTARRPYGSSTTGTYQPQPPAS